MEVKNIELIQPYVSTEDTGAFLLTKTVSCEKILTDHGYMPKIYIKYQYIIEVARRVCVEQRSMSLEVIQSIETTAKSEIMQKLASFFDNNKLKNHILMICADSTPEGHILSTLTELGPSLIAPHEIAHLWKKSYEKDPDKRLLIIFDIEHWEPWRPLISASENPGIMFKTFSPPSNYAKAKDFSEPYCPGVGLQLFLKINDIRAVRSNRCLFRTFLNSFMEPIMFQENEELVQSQFALILTSKYTDYGGMVSCYSCKKEHFSHSNPVRDNCYFGYVDPESKLPHGYGQYKTGQNLIVFEGIFEKGVLVRKLAPKETTNGEFFGHYQSEGEFTLVKFDPTEKVQKCSIKQFFVAGKKMIEIRWFCDFPKQLLVFKLLNGNATILHFLKEKLICKERGEFWDGVLNGEGERKFLELENGSTESGFFENGVLVRGRSKRYRWLNPGAFVSRKMQEEELSYTQVEVTYTGEFKDGSFVAGRIEFGIESPMQEFRGESMSKTKEVWSGRMSYSNRFVAEGEFDAGFCLTKLDRLYTPNGKIVDSALIYSTNLNAKKSVAIDPYGNVFVGDFVNGVIQGRIAVQRPAFTLFGRKQPMNSSSLLILPKNGDLVYAMAFESIIVELLS